MQWTQARSIYELPDVFNEFGSTTVAALPSIFLVALALVGLGWFVLKLRDRGVGRVIVTLGSQGVCVADEAGVRHFPAPAAACIDTTGAGDTFIGAYAAAVREGLSTDAAIARAQTAAALSVGRAGAMASMPTRAECLAAQGRTAP